VTGDGDLSHGLSEYFGSWRGLAYVQARSTVAWLKSEGGVLATVNEVACATRYSQRRSDNGTIAG
jgi:hypothetical protein